MHMKRNVVLLVVFLIIHSSCHSQNTDKAMQTIDRKPAVAGQFYPGDAQVLKRDLEKLFAQAKPGPTPHLAALIVPHAGYVFSGKVAASGFNQIDPEASYDNIFILGPSHRAGFEGASVYDRGAYLTPLGRAEVNTELASELISKYPFFSFRPEADTWEHDIEVQIPFLQYHLRKPFRIVPILLGTERPEVLQKIATALQPWFNERNLFVISTDFSHYPSFEDAISVDMATARAIASNQPDTLLEVLRLNKAKHISGLATSLCGASAVLTLLYITSKIPGIIIKDIDYQNSGHSPYGDHDRVVGYHAMTVVRQHATEQGFQLNDEEKKTLLGLARNTIMQYLKTGTRSIIPYDKLTPALRQPCGAFVTLHKSGELRGCIGHFGADKPLYEVVADMAIAAAFNDTRFMPVRENEMKDIDIEISVLTPMRKINSIREIQLGKHGIYIKKGWQAGTFLPQVATETGWTLEEFLGHCSRDKAGLGWDGWKNADIFVYEALVFGEKDFNL